MNGVLIGELFFLSRGFKRIHIFPLHNRIVRPTRDLEVQVSNVSCRHVLGLQAFDDTFENAPSASITANTRLILNTLSQEATVLSHAS